MWKGITQTRENIMWKSQRAEVIVFFKLQWGRLIPDALILERKIYAQFTHPPICDLSLVGEKKEGTTIVR